MIHVIYSSLIAMSSNDCTAVGTAFLPQRQTAKNSNWEEENSAAERQARIVIFKDSHVTCRASTNEDDGWSGLRNHLNHRLLLVTGRSTWIHIGCCTTLVATWVICSRLWRSVLETIGHRGISRRIAWRWSSGWTCTWCICRWSLARERLVASCGWGWATGIASIHSSAQNGITGR